MTDVKNLQRENVVQTLDNWLEVQKNARIRENLELMQEAATNILKLSYLLSFTGMINSSRFFIGKKVKLWQTEQIKN